MHSTIKHSYVAPIALHTEVAAATLGTASRAGEPLAGFHI